MKKIIMILVLFLTGCSSLTHFNVNTAFDDLEKVGDKEIKIKNCYLQEYEYDENKYNFYAELGNQEVDQLAEQSKELYNEVAAQIKQAILDLEFKVVDKIQSTTNTWLMKVSFVDEEVEYRFNFYVEGGIKVEKQSGSEIEHVYVQVDEKEAAAFLVAINDLWEEYESVHMELFDLYNSLKK